MIGSERIEDGMGGGPGTAAADASALPEIRLLGFRLNPLTGAEAVAAIADAIAARRRLIMANLNLHGMAVSFDNPRMARLLCQSDSRVMIDSMPLLLMAKLAGHRLSRDKRATSLDFYDQMFARAVDERWKVGFVGGKQTVMRQGVDRLSERFPGLSIDGRHGYFTIDDDAPGSYQAALVDWLNDDGHDLLIVGMGMPRQEEWIERVQHRVPTRVFLPTGAYMDYQVGAQKRPPRWLGQMGFEWAYRLIRSPRRLAYRYLIEPMILMYRLATRPHPQAPQPQPQPQPGQRR